MEAHIEYLGDDEPLEGIPMHMETYGEDGRRSLDDLYTAYLRLAEEYGWRMETVFRQRDVIGDRELLLPVFSFITPLQGPALWLLSGIHGEEPAGPNAIVEELDRIGVLGKEVPMVVMPLCNPKGYRRNWRFQDTAAREYKSLSHPDGGVSVSDTEHMVIAPDHSGRPRLSTPLSPECDTFTRYVLERAQSHPPVVVLDFHEDEEQCMAPYIFTNGPRNEYDPIAKEVVRILGDAGMPLWMDGRTRFGHEVIGGVVANVYDGSIDELLAAKEVWSNGQIVPGPGARSVVVIETPITGIALPKRIQAHRAVLGALPELWKIA